MSAKKAATNGTEGGIGKPESLSRREREIMNVLYRTSRATVAEVREALSDPPSYSAVRAMLRILLEKGHATYQQDGPRYVYLPAVSRDRAKKSALRQLLSTFFDNSAEQAISALLGEHSSKLSAEDLDRISAMVEKARAEGR